MSIMTLHNKEKLNQLINELPEGVVAPMLWLSEQGYSRQLINSYAKADWLTNLGHGVYAKPAVPISWQGIVLGLQILLKNTCHVGGQTALNRLGFAHHLPFGKNETIYLWGNNFPAWVQKIKQADQVVILKKQLFKEDVSHKLGLEKSPTHIREWQLAVASPERAILEVIYLLKNDENDFFAAAEIMSSLMTLRPKLMHALLQACRDIKVKRVTLFLAEHFELPWLSGIDTKRISLGSGKRQVVKGGCFDKKYQITIPKSFGKDPDSGFSKNIT